MPTAAEGVASPQQPFGSEDVHASVGCVVVSPHPGIAECTEERGPGGSLVIGAVACGNVSRVLTDVGGITRAQGAKAGWCEQLTLDRIDDETGALAVDKLQRKAADGEDPARF